MITAEMSNAEYHGAEGISKSDLDLVHRSAANWHYVKTHKLESAPALVLGSAAHCAVLEPERFKSEYAVAPRFDRRTKSGKEEYAAWKSSLAPGVEAIDDETMEMVQNIAAAVQAHPIAKLLIETTMHEASVFTKYEGATIKCRPDGWSRDGGYVVDLKTTMDASAAEFRKSAAKWRYHVQAAWYAHVIEQETGERPDNFYFVAVEKTPPYGAAVYTLDEDALAWGWVQAYEDFNRLKVAIETQRFQSYEPRIQTLTLPRWAFGDNVATIAE